MHLTSQDLDLVRQIYLDISREGWFDQGKKEAMAAYVIHMFQRGMVDPIKLKNLCMIAARKKFCLAEYHLQAG